MDLACEVWRSIPSLAGYSASSQGEVRRDPCKIAMPRGGFRALDGAPRKANIVKGRRKITIGRRSHNVAALVCEAFHGPKPFPRAEAMHLDEHALNDVPGNLAWGSRRENMNAPKLRASMSARQTGQLHHNAKLTNADVADIRQQHGIRSARDIAAQYDIRREYVHQIWAAHSRKAG